MRMAYRRSGRVIFLSKRVIIIIMMMRDQIIMNSYKGLWEKDTFGLNLQMEHSNLFCNNTLDLFSV